MYDALPNPTRNDLLDEVRCFFVDHGHDLSDAARLIAGVAGEARVISLALRLERAVALDEGIRRDLAALHALLALEKVREGDPIETFLLSGPGPASRRGRDHLPAHRPPRRPPLAGSTPSWLRPRSRRTTSRPSRPRRRPDRPCPAPARGRVLKPCRGGRGMCEDRMTTSTVFGPGLEDLALDTICLGRDLVRAASLADLGAGNPKFGEMAQVLLRLADRNPFRPADDHFLRALRVVLVAEVAREVIGTERLVSSPTTASRENSSSRGNDPPTASGGRGSSRSSTSSTASWPPGRPRSTALRPNARWSNFSARRSGPGGLFAGRREARRWVRKRRIFQCKS